MKSDIELLDRFACAALPAVIKEHGLNYHYPVAIEAYKQARAMLEVRKEHVQELVTMKTGPISDFINNNH